MIFGGPVVLKSLVCSKHRRDFADSHHHFATKKPSPTQDTLFPPLHISQTVQKQAGNEVLGSGNAFRPMRILNQNP